MARGARFVACAECSGACTILRSSSGAALVLLQRTRAAETKGREEGSQTCWVRLRRRCSSGDAWKLKNRGGKENHHYAVRPRTRRSKRRLYRCGMNVVTGRGAQAR